MSQMSSVFVVMKMYELNPKSLLKLGYVTFASTVVIINKDTWASIPDDLKPVLRDTIRELLNDFTKQIVDENPAAFETLEDNGVEVYEWPQSEVQKAVDAGTAIWTEWVNDMESQGLPGKQVMKAFLDVLRENGQNPPNVPLVEGS
jgi:TRAP-type C4-dicarboxylate transport system substrate-binding protein